MSKARWFFGAVLLLAGVVAGGFYFVRLAVIDMATFAIESVQNFHLGGQALGEIKRKNIAVSPRFSSEEEKKTRSLVPNIGIVVEGVEATVGSVDLTIDSVLFEYSVKSNTARVTIPGGVVNVSMLPSGAVVGEKDLLRCDVGARVILEWRGNLLLQHLKKMVFGKAESISSISRVQYIDDNNVSCTNIATGEVIPVYKKVNFGFDVVDDTGIKLNTEVSLLMEEPSRFLYLGIDDLLIDQDSKEKRIDVYVPKFKLSSDDFALSVSGSLALDDTCYISSHFGCKMDILLEMQGHGKLFNLLSKSAADRFWVDDESGKKMLEGIDSIRRVTRRAADRYDESSDTVTLALKSDGGELSVGKMSFDQFSAEVLKEADGDNREKALGKDDKGDKVTPGKEY
ncbi:hypothetical protein R4I06_03600 [Anaplasma bovis]